MILIATNPRFRMNLRTKAIKKVSQKQHYEFEDYINTKPQSLLIADSNLRKFNI